jgi:hypothetical protein
MSKTRPEQFTRWASCLAQSDLNKEYNRYEPPTAKKDIGWEYGEVPPRQLVNYQENLTCMWLEYLDSQKHTAQIYAKKEDLPEARESKGLLVFIESCELLAFSDGKAWKKLTTENL